MIEILEQIHLLSGHYIIIFQTHGNDISTTTTLIDSRGHEYWVDQYFAMTQERTDAGVGAAEIHNHTDEWDILPLERFLYVQ